MTLTAKEKVPVYEAALIGIHKALLPQAMPWTGTDEELALYTAIVLEFHAGALQRLLALKSKQLEDFEKSLAEGLGTLEAAINEIPPECFDNRLVNMTVQQTAVDQEIAQKYVEEMQKQETT